VLKVYILTRLFVNSCYSLSVSIGHDGVVAMVENYRMQPRCSSDTAAERESWLNRRPTRQVDPR